MRKCNFQKYDIDLFFESEIENKTVPWIDNKRKNDLGEKIINDEYVNKQLIANPNNIRKDCASYNMSIIVRIRRSEDDDPYPFPGYIFTLIDNLSLKTGQDHKTLAFTEENICEQTTTTSTDGKYEL